MHVKYEINLSYKKTKMKNVHHMERKKREGKPIRRKVPATIIHQPYPNTKEDMAI
jgi:hypothetical protein